MTPKLPCPNCGSVKVMAVPDSDRLLCYNCKHEFVAERAVTPGIFLSYARGDDESFVVKLHADLTAQGFDVWFDRVNMPSRALTFHQEIKDAIRERDRLVLVVGPKAVTSDYVTEEWRFAWESEKEVVPVFRLGDYLLVPD
jgi:hypothetical protein